jgi:hypothetical protein
MWGYVNKKCEYHWSRWQEVGKGGGTSSESDAVAISDMRTDNFSDSSI